MYTTHKWSGTIRSKGEYKMGGTVTINGKEYDGSFGLSDYKHESDTSECTDKGASGISQQMSWTDYHTDRFTVDKSKLYNWFKVFYNQILGI